MLVLSDKGGEIETKILSLKGGAGLILVALGIVLLALGGGIQLPAGISEKLPLTEEVKTEPGFKPTPTVTSTPAPTSQRLAGTPASTPIPTVPASKSVILEPIGKESGSVYNLGTDSGTWGDINGVTAGDEPYSYAKQVQAFLSFNIAGIPANATITNAILDFSVYRRREDPFSGLGCLGAYEQNFGVPDTSDFFIGTPTGAIARWCSDGELSEPSPGNELISALQSKLGKNRLQIRVQFDKATDNDGQHDEIFFTPKLMVTYTTP